MQEYRLLSIQEAADLIGRSPSWLRALIRRGYGPPARRVSERCIQIRLDDLQKWLEKLPVASCDER